MRPKIDCSDHGGSPSELAREFFGYLTPTDSAPGEADECRTAEGSFDDGRIRDEIRYLKAFAVHYSACQFLGESPEGSALRTAFMGIWDKASRTNAAQMQSLNEFLKRIDIYGQLINTGTSSVPFQANDRIPNKFAELLDAELDPSSLARIASSAATHFNGVYKGVADALTRAYLQA